MDDNSYICVTQAKKNYNLNENDLKDLECIYKRNPYYRSAPPMRLYLIKDLEKNIGGIHTCRT